MIEDQNRTLWCGNLPDQVTEEILYELFLQAGPLEKVKIARDREGRHKNFAFITYCHEVSVPYAVNLFQGTALFHRTLSLKCRGRMALLPPAIRCFGPDPAIDFSNITQQFAEMTEKRPTDNFIAMPVQRNNSNDKLVMASLQGNWYRHHPYRAKDRDDYRPRERESYGDYRGRNKYSNNWRDRRHMKKSNYQRRD